MALPNTISSGETGKSGATGKTPVIKKVPAWMTTGNAAASYATNADLAAMQTLAQKRAQAANANNSHGVAGLNTSINGGGVTPSSYATPSTVSAGSGPSAQMRSSSPTAASDPAVSGTSAGGYAGKYRTGLESTVAYDNPEILASDVLKSMGINDPTLAAMLASDANFASLAAFLTAGNGANATSDSAIVNYMGNYLKNQATVGGQGPDTGALVQSILNAGSDPNGQIAQYLGINSSVPNANQLQSVTNLVNNTLQNTLNDQNPYTQRATKNMLAQQASNYAAAQAHGGSPGSYTDYLKKSDLSNWF